jgi:aldehyde dehydrogenase (NAD+)
MKDTDPYSGDTIGEIAMANRADLDEAYQSAAKAQIGWAALLPSERSAGMARLATIMEARRPEIVDWLIRESQHSHQGRT